MQLENGRSDIDKLDTGIKCPYSERTRGELRLCTHNMVSVGVRMFGDISLCVSVLAKRKHESNELLICRTRVLTEPKNR